MSQDFEIKGCAARWLGDQLTSFQEFYFWIMVLSLLLWPILAFVALFFSDAPSRSIFDDICKFIFKNQNKRENKCQNNNYYHL